MVNREAVRRFDVYLISLDNGTRRSRDCPTVGSEIQKTRPCLVISPDEMNRHLATIPEVADVQIYAVNAAPFNFNGLVRQYYLRADPSQGELVVNLADKSRRNRKSHEIARAVRPLLAALGRQLGAKSVQATYDALKAAKVKAEAHFFEEGGHGYGIGPDNAPAGLWPQLFARWLDRTLG